MENINLDSLKAELVVYIGLLEARIEQYDKNTIQGYGGYAACAEVLGVLSDLEYSSDPKAIIGVATSEISELLTFYTRATDVISTHRTGSPEQDALGSEMSAFNNGYLSSLNLIISQLTLIRSTYEGLLTE